jgi:hypothetical protein
MKAELLATDYLRTDDTPVLVCPLTWRISSRSISLGA